MKSEREKSIVPQQEVSPAEEEKETVEFRYIGQAFKLFLIVEKGDELLFIDQHAAHERILYNELIQQIDVQKLLIPIELDTDQATSEFLDEHSHVYTKLGIMLSKTDDGRWEITALPAACRPIETEIVDFIESARMDYEAAIDTIESTVSSTYASAMLGKERIAFLEARMDADKLKAEMSVQREDIGYSSSSDTLQAQMAVIQDEIEIITERITLSQNAYTLMYLAAYDPGRIPTISDGMAQ